MNTRNLTFSVILFFGTTLNLSAQTTNVIFVKPGNNGDGSSWGKAFNDLQQAINQSKKGYQIWVSEGIYFTTEGSDRSISFNLPDGVAIYGGFAGNEKKLSERNADQHPTILSGNIGSEDATDNAYNVIYTKNASPATILDGFIVTGGHADGDGQTANRKRSGAGFYNEGSGKGQSNPTITNCTFIDNYAKDGGAIYNNGKAGEASPKIGNCSFENNKSDLDGGAVYNDGRANGKSTPAIENCRFEGNAGNYGGAVFNYGMNGTAEPKFLNCVFSNNNAYVKGGAIFNIADSHLDRATLGNSVFSNNSALDHDSDDIHHYLISSSQMAGN